MPHNSIVDSIADRADEILADVRGVSDARSSIAEVLAAEHPKLSGAERQKITDSVIRILEEEGFFDGSAGGDEWSEEGGEDSDE